MVVSNHGQRVNHDSDNNAESHQNFPPPQRAPSRSSREESRSAQAQGAGGQGAVAKSKWIPIVQKSYLLSSHCSPGPPNPPKSAHSRQLGPVDSCIPVG